MQKKSLFAVAALGATCLLPMSGAFAAQDDHMNTRSGSASMSGSVMDAGQFRDALHKVHDLFTRIRENNDLALASQDSLVASKYEDENRRLHVKALGILDEASHNWKTSSAGSMEGETAEMRSSRSIERLGTADGVRYATESDDTAFVRNTVWNLRNMLNADKLNGRAPMINSKMMSMLDAAISRSENPSFRVAWHSLNRELLSRNIEFSRREEAIISPRAVTTVERTEAIETPAAVEETTVEERTEVAQAPTPAPTTLEETTETTTERAGAASLPQTGGDPGMLVLFGSSIVGMGAFLRRRK